MGFGCPICSEKLEKLPAEAQNRESHSGRELNIAATPCGHMFHAYCIQKWLSGSLASSKQCPCCRKDVPRLRCLSLYPTTFDESILDDSLSQGSDSGPIPCNHGEAIASMKNQIDRLQSDIKEKDQMYELLSTDYSTLLEKFRTEKLSSDTWMMRAKQYESYRDLADELEARTKKTELQLKTYTQLESMLKGVETCVTEDLVNTPPTTDAVRSLLEIKHVLSAELRKKDKTHKDLKEAYESIRTEKQKLRVQYEKKVKELKELKHIYEISKVNGRVRSTSPPPGPSGLFEDGTTPKAFRTKRRFQETAPAPTPITEVGKTMTTSPDIDADVDIFQVKPKKVKPASSARPESKRNKCIENVKMSSKFPCAISPIASTFDSPRLQPLDSTITLDDDSEEDELRIRGNVPGAPLPISTTRMKNLLKKSERPTLGSSSSSVSRSKKFTFKKSTTET